MRNALTQRLISNKHLSCYIYSIMYHWAFPPIYPLTISDYNFKLKYLSAFQQNVEFSVKVHFTFSIEF